MSKLKEMAGAFDEFLERRAKFGNQGIPECEALARVAIETLRNPTQGARIAVHGALINSDACSADIGHLIGFKTLGDAWRAMIDEALK